MSSEATTLTLKNIHLLDLKRWLDVGLPAGKLNRDRNEFLRSIKQFADDLETNRLEIVKRYAEKGENGEVNTLNPEFPTPEARQSAEDEFAALVQEPINIPISKPAAFETVKEILRTTERKMGNQEGERFDEVAEAMGIKFE